MLVFLGNMLKIPGRVVKRPCEGTIIIIEGTTSSRFLIPPHPLTNFEIQRTEFRLKKTEFRLKNIDQIRNYFTEEIIQKELMSTEDKNVSGILNHIEHLMTLVSTVTGCASIYSFASFLGVPVDITGSTVRLKICVITTVI